MKSWPRLCLGDEGIWTTLPRPQIALVGLASLLLHCPDLYTLGIGMVTTPYSVVAPEVPGGGVINTKIIITLSVGASLIANPLAVAFLSSIMPNWKNILYKVDSDSAKSNGGSALVEVGESWNVSAICGVGVDQEAGED